MLGVMQSVEKAIPHGSRVAQTALIVIYYVENNFSNTVIITGRQMP